MAPCGVTSGHGEGRQVWPAGPGEAMGGGYVRPNAAFTSGLNR